MNIEKAKAIPIAEILAKLDLHPIKVNDKESWYFSPFRNEKTPSLHIHNLKNLWFDFGEAKGGDGINLVQEILKQQGKNYSVSSALFWLKDIVNVNYQQPQKQSEVELPRLVLKSVSQIKNLALKRYLEKRGIPLTVAEKFLLEIRFKIEQSGKSIFALGLLNEDEGYEVRNSFFKGCVGKKDISFIRGTEIKPSGINIFEGMFDYLTVITQRNGKTFKNDTIILNTLSNIKHVKPYIKNYGYRFGYSWLDNDQAGRKSATELMEMFKTENIAFCPMNSLYQPYKDVNAAHIAKLEL